MLQLAQQLCQRVKRKLRRMRRSRGQRPKMAQDFGATQHRRFREGSPAHQFGQQGRAGDRRYAAFCLETDLNDCIALRHGGQLHDVAARRILYLHRRLGVRKNARVARVLKVIE